MTEARKIIANYGPRSVEALERLQELTGDRQTDILNRAVQIYRSIAEDILVNGKKYLIVDESSPISVDITITEGRQEMTLAAETFNPMR